LAPLLGAGVFLAGLAAAGKAARAWLRQQGQATIAFTEMQCLPPPDEDRERFLLEVQSLSELPDRISLLDDNLATTLTRAFGRHPWVEKVKRVAVLPSRELQVELLFRTPVLAVETTGPTRVVDAQGVLLPPGTSAVGLPIIKGPSTPPVGLSGAPWGDAAVEAAARTAGYVQPYQERLRLRTVEILPGGSLLWRTAAGTRVDWGHAPGAESADELSAAQKRERLVRYCEDHGDLDHPSGVSRHELR
jgi:hypothetical protein